MAKLVVISEGFAGRSYELKVDNTTIGRMEDNAFQIPDQSVSGHHCEVVLKGQDIVVKDLNSTNGTFINGDKVTEKILKHGQVLRLGNIDLRLEVEGAVVDKKVLDSQTRVIPRGVQADELQNAGNTSVKFNKDTSPFAKKDNKINKIFVAVGILLAVVILGLLVYAFMQMGKGE